MPAAAFETYLGQVDKRIFGLESEYGLTCVFREQRRLSPDEVARDLFRRVDGSGDVLLPNGARLSLEVAWERVLDSVATGNLDAIAREIDWVTKYQLIERYRATHGLPLSSPEIAQLDLAYHDVNRGRGGYYLLQRHGAVERAIRDIDIFEAKTVPPPPGRYRQAG